MKQILLFLILLSSALAQRQLYDTDSSVITANAESISPYPVEPGQDFTVQFRVYNDGGESAQDVSVHYVRNDLFILTGKDDELSESFNLCAGCTKDTIYYFTVSPDASSGNYPLNFQISEESNYHEEKVFVRVVGQPDVIFIAQLLDELVVPDSAFRVLLTVKNVGTGVARNLKLVPATQGFVMRESNLIFIDEIKPNQELNETVTFMTSDSLETGPQTIDFEISYKDESSNTYELDQSLGLNLMNQVEIDISSVSFTPQIIEAHDEVDLMVRVENLGEGEARNIRVEIMSDKLTGQKKAYVGKLEEDEDAPAYFTLSTGFSGSSELDIVVSYEDDLGEHTVTEKVSLRVVKPKSLPLLVLSIIFGILAVVLFIYARRKHAK